MVINSSDSDYTGNSSDFSENPSIPAGFTDKNICGRGATCIVYGMQIQGLHVAVKRLLKEKIDEPTCRKAFRKEYRIGCQLKHDALPVYRDFKDEPKEAYIVMDYIDGASVSQFVLSDEGSRYFSSPDNVKRFLSESVGVVGYLHRKGVIHCDIKPANIMMRHTDRGVMLIDFDKAYSDTLDSSTGGTTGFSDLLKKGENPTVQKDFVAIGRTLDHIAECTPHFPRRQFRRFRRECDNPDTTAEKLMAVLRPQSNKAFWIGGVLLCLCITAGIGYFMYRDSSDSERIEESATQPIELTPDTAIDKKSKVDTPEIIIPSKPLTQESRRIIIKDFDIQMADFIREAQKSLDNLSTGTATDRQISDMMSNIIEAYTSGYNALLNDYKSDYPGVDGIDVELAVARASEKSLAAKLLLQFTQAARDTTEFRHPESKMDE